MPIYNLFEKLLKKDHVENTIKSVSKIIPLLYKIRVEHVESYLEEFKRQFIREYKEKAISGNLQNTIIVDKINSVLDDDHELEKLLQRNINYNIEHIVPVLVFRIRKLLQEKDNGQLDLTIPKKNRSNFFKGLIQAIYTKYIELKLGGLPSSLTTVVRDRKYYESGLEAYIAFKNMLKFPETDYIAKNSCILK